MSTVGLRLKFQSAFANLMPACKTTAIVQVDVGDSNVGDDEARTLKACNLDKEFVREHSKIFGLKNQSAKLTDWQNAVNASALQLALEHPSLLYDRGTLKLRAEEKARQTYVFKKRTGSRSTKLDGEPQPKRSKVSQERGKMAEISAEIEILKKQISTKQNIISKANSVKDYQLCDKTQTEWRKLVKEKGRCERELAEFQKKEAKSNWYYKGKGKSESKSTSGKKVPLPPQSALQSMDIRKLLSTKAHDSKPKATETTSSINVNLPAASATDSTSLEEGGPSETSDLADTMSSGWTKDDIPATLPALEIITVSDESGTSEKESLQEDSTQKEGLNHMNASDEPIEEKSFLG